MINLGCLGEGSATYFKSPREKTSTFWRQIQLCDTTNDTLEEGGNARSKHRTLLKRGGNIRPSLSKLI